MKKLLVAMAVIGTLGFSGLAVAGSHNPCNPCSMKSSEANPCSMKESKKANPCSMKGHNPCSMKKSKKANPCDMKSHNPCSMKKMNPCNPCAGASKGEDGNKPIRKVAFSNFQEASDLGKKMWNDESLGSSGLSCLSCHSGYTNLNLEKRQNFPHLVNMVGDVVTLDQMINYCMINPMQGKQFEKNSKELTAMAAYYRTYRMEYLNSQRH